MTLTRRALLRLVAGLGLAGIAATAWATVVTPGLRLAVARHTVRSAAFTGAPVRIAILADPHASPPWMGLDRLGGIVETANGLAPDLTLLLGDYIVSHPFHSRIVSPKEVARVFAGLRAQMGVFAVLGNHDWWDDAEAQARGSGPLGTRTAFEAEGIPLLSNRAVALERESGERLWLAGLESQLALTPLAGFRDRTIGLDDLDGTLEQVEDDAPVVLMAHEPDIFPRVPDRVALTLSGHTHGGQVRLFGWSPVVPSRFGNRYAYGHVIEDGRHLVVSGGLGCTMAPIRLGVPPEITLIELEPAA